MLLMLKGSKEALTVLFVTHDTHHTHVKGSKEAFMVLIVTHVTHVEGVKGSLNSFICYSCNSCQRGQKKT